MTEFSHEDWRISDEPRKGEILVRPCPFCNRKTEQEVSGIISLADYEPDAWVVCLDCRGGCGMGCTYVHASSHFAPIVQKAIDQSREVLGISPPVLVRADTYSRRIDRA